jgi:hypothetical protein
LKYEQVVADYLSSLPKQDEETEGRHGIATTTRQLRQNEPQTQQHEPLSNEVLQKLVVQTLETTDRPNPKYVPISVLVVNALETDTDVTQFIKSWRQLFVETLQPRYLPTGWSVDSSVENDG